MNEMQLSVVVSSINSVFRRGVEMEIIELVVVENFFVQLKMDEI